MIDAFKTNGSSPPRSAAQYTRRDTWLGLAAILAPWIAPLIVTAIWWPR
jgi:hypothetical protein